MPKTIDELLGPGTEAPQQSNEYAKAMLESLPIPQQLRDDPNWINTSDGQQWLASPEGQQWNSVASAAQGDQFAAGELLAARLEGQPNAFGVTQDSISAAKQSDAPAQGIANPYWMNTPEGIAWQNSQPGLQGGGVKFVDANGNVTTTGAAQEGALRAESQQAFLGSGTNALGTQARTIGDYASGVQQQQAADIGAYGTQAANVLGEQGAALQQATNDRANAMAAEATGARQRVTGAAEQAFGGLQDYSQGVGQTVASDATRAGSALSQLGAAQGQQVAQYGQEQAQRQAQLATGAGASVTGSANTAAAGLTGTAAGIGRPGAMATRQAMTTANQLGGLEATEGPSAAQAQLTAGLSQTQAANLALARSGRGFGSSASALTQAVDQNAAAAQAATAQAATLRAQENAAWRQRQAANLGTAAQTLGNIGTTSTGQAANLVGQAAGIQAQGAQAGAQLAVAGTQAARELGAQGVAQGAQLGTTAATNAAQLSQQGVQAGAQLGVAGTQAAAQGYTQGVTNAAQLALSGNESAGNLAIQGGSAAANTTAQAAQLGLTGLGQQAALFNTAIGNEAAGVQAQAALEQQQVANQQAYEDYLLRKYAAEKGIALQGAQQNTQLLGAGIGALGTLGAAALMASDERVKEEIAPADDDVLEAFDALDPASFEYSDPGLFGSGRVWGVMAQDLERTEAGASVVEEHGGVKMLNVGKLAALNTAGIAAMADRFSRIEAELEELRGKARHGRVR